MITKKTVFILGAGASKPFGLPLGYELLENVSNELIYTRPQRNIFGKPLNAFGQFRSEMEEYTDDTKSSNELFQYLLDLGFGKKEIEKFRVDLLGSDLNSVDAFLEIRTEFIGIGKIAIAHSLLKFERLDNLLKTPNWYRYLWSKMVSDLKDFGKNKVAFITYNYDRTLEQYFIKKLISLYDISEEDAFKKLSEIPIIHLHGKLGELPSSGKTGNVSFGEEISLNKKCKLESISKSIKIIHEDISGDPEFNEAKYLLKDAESICLLGFGFNQKNIDRLGLNGLKKQVFASGYKLNRTDHSSIMKRNPVIKIDDMINHDTMAYLTNSFVIE